MWRERPTVTAARPGGCASEDVLADSVQQNNQTNGGQPSGQPGNDGAGANAPPTVPDLATVTANLEKANAELAALQKRTKELSDEAAKHRVRAKEEAEKAKKAAEQEANELAAKGEFSKLYETEKAQRAAAEKSLADAQRKAERYDAIETRRRASIDAAKAKGDLPSYIMKAIDSATDVESAYEILEDFRASQRTTAPTTPAATPKQPADPAPPPGAPTTSPTPRKRPEDMTPVDWEQLRMSDPKAYAALMNGFDGSPNGKQPVHPLLAAMGGRKQ